ncbi:hypothetical protein GJAV_G00065230 [Gymnothorax javanicus]|nr:hypothetical protein GJAV_G00065230 [Gymnothorax javanicus]
MVRNTDVLKQAQAVDIATVTAANRLRWFNHVVRMPEELLPKVLLNWKPNYGKRSRGCPRKTWHNCALEDVGHFLGIPNITLEEAQELASDRAKWCRMISKKRCFPGAGQSND